MTDNAQKRDRAKPGFTSFCLLIVIVAVVFTQSGDRHHGQLRDFLSSVFPPTETGDD